MGLGEGAGPISFHGQGILLCWALGLILKEIDREAENLARPRSPFHCPENWTWESLLDFSLHSQYGVAIRESPIMWSILMTIAIGKNQRKADHQEVGERDPWQVRLIVCIGAWWAQLKLWQGAVTVLSVLLYFRNREAALFQRAVSIVLFSCNAGRFLHRFLNRVGFSTSYSSLIGRLQQLGDSVVRTLEDLGNGVRSGEVSVVWIYDNIQRNYVAWNQTVSNKNTMRTGTASTVLIMDGVSKGDLNPNALASRLHLRSNLTFDDLIKNLDQEHLDNIGKATLISIWTRHIDALHDLSHEATTLFTDKYKKHPLRLRKSIYFSLKTSAIDESRPLGAKDVLADIALQLKLQETDFNNILIPVAGDLVTVDRVRKLKRYTCTDVGNRNQHKWAFPWIQLWHLKWTALRSFYNTHWAPNIGKHLYGLRSDCNTLQRKNLNPTKCDFYSHSEAAIATFECLCIGALR
jgi:hypothetical protein